VVVVGGFWLLRNLAATGNPVFPQRVAVAELTLFDAPNDPQRDLIGFSLAHYLDQPSIWRHVFWPSFLKWMSWFVVLLWLLIPAAGALALARLRRLRASDRAAARSILVCVAIATGIGLIYLVTPYTAQGPPGQPVFAAANARYVVPALTIGAAVSAWLCGRAGRARLLIEIAAFLGFIHALRGDPHVSATAVAAAGLALAATGGAIWIARTRPWPGRSWRSPLAAAVGACSVLVVAGGLYAHERRFEHRRYAGSEGVGRWIGTHAPSGHRVGVVGEGFVVHPLFGPRLRNHVEYVGPVRQGLLRVYAHRGELERALRRGRYDFVLVVDVKHIGPIEPALADRQKRWLRGMGYRLVAAGRQDTAYHTPEYLFAAPGS
jgi:hypothetical protein